MPIGIFLFSYIAVKLKLTKLPQKVTWGQIAEVGALAGIGFTMSLFISNLALSSEFEVYAKTGILFGSVLSIVLGYLYLPFLRLSLIRNYSSSFLYLWLF